MSATPHATSVASAVRDLSTATAPHVPSRTTLRLSYLLTGLAVLFMTFDVGIKLLQLPVAVEGTTVLGYPASSVWTIGVIQLLCLVLYVLPPTAVLGAVLFTGYLGGAVATHLRLGNPLLTHQIFPLYVAAFLWGGLYLREPRLRALLPLRR